MVYELNGEVVEQDGHRYPGVLFEGELMPEAYLHDSSILPHLVPGDFRKLFPRAVPAEELKEAHQQDDWLDRLSGQWMR